MCLKRNQNCFSCQQIEFSLWISNCCLTFSRFKGIVSNEILVPFFISLDRFEGRNRAGSGLFFILKTF
jgi:hypothetical protein